MNKSKNETKKSGQKKQKHEKQEYESPSESKETDSVTGDQESSSTSENARQYNKNQQKQHKKSSSSATTGGTASSSVSFNHQNIHSTAGTATQFSVQRSDVDGLRMKISAIRTKPQISSPIPGTLNTISDKVNHNNNNNLASSFDEEYSDRAIKVKISNKNKQQQNSQDLPKDSHNQQQFQERKTERSTSSASTLLINNNMSANVALNNPTNCTASAIQTPMNENIQQKLINIDVNNVSSTIVSTSLPLQPCLSDATESGCSEATTTTILTTIDKSTKKIKVKRKKVQSKQNSSSKKYKKPRTQVFSSDSDDEPLISQHQPQRAPRLLITAINTKASLSLKGLTNAATSSSALNNPNHESDNIGLSSSDNEIPNLVNAAIKCVESDTDDTIGETNLRRNKSKHLPQYQSTLLQDFMEITQMIGENATDLNTNNPSKSARTELVGISNVNSQNESFNLNISASCPTSAKKKRGRPKKVPDPVPTIETNIKNKVLPNVSNINESADSGVISTTSTTQSTTPSPRIPSIGTPTKAKKADSILGTQISPAKSASGVESSNSLTTSKPKIDIAYLDKRMYATERVLYPPPRNKRRQSQKLSASSISLNSTATKVTKEELKLDPVWKKIDVNKKFRRPSLSGYKSDGGNTTICSKILAAKSGYVSDYGSFHPRSSRHHHLSGYKSDASCKSRYSVRSCVSRRSRAKSCGYRSDCKESGATLKSSKFRRKRRASMLMRSQAKSVVDLSDDQDILQLACLSLGQSSEESNEYVCKPNLASLPTTSASKKYGEINRFIATGEYFGRGSSGGSYGSQMKNYYEVTNDDVSQDGFTTRLNKKLLQQRKDSDIGNDLLPHVSLRKIKSRRSSVASCCSSFYSGTSKIRRRHRRKSFRFPTSSNGKNPVIDSKLLTDIEIITSTFSTLCSLHNIGLGASTSGGNSATESSGNSNPRLSNNLINTSSLTGKEKLIAESNKLQQSLSLSGMSALGSPGIGNKTRDKRMVKKRKIVDSLVDFAMLSAQSSGGASKRRHKKANSSSPDDHKLPLKKRHYLLTPGEKPIEATLSLSAKMYANSIEAWAAAAAVAKSTATTKSQQQFNAQKSSKQGLTPKKRHFLQNPGIGTHLQEDAPTIKSNKSSNSSPLRIVVDTTNSISGGKLLDISPISLSSLKQQTDAKKRSRLEGVVSKISHDGSGKETSKHSGKLVPSAPEIDAETSCPPPGVFEPSVELEIPIAPIAKLSEATASIITKSEVDSPLLDLDLPVNNSKNEGPRVVETLLNKTGGNLILKRKRKKINRTGFPTVKRKKRKITENLVESVIPAVKTHVNKETVTSNKSVDRCKSVSTMTSDKMCDRVPRTGETSETFLERANRTPRLSVVALERLQGSPTNIQTSLTSKSCNDKKSSIKKLKPGRKKSKEAIDLNASLECQKGKKKKITEVFCETSVDIVKPKRKNAPKEDRASNPNLIKSKKPIGKNKQASVGRPSKSQILTAKSLESKVKLPAGIDPNTNFSCKIRLKRRNPAHLSSQNNDRKKCDSPTPESVNAEATAKENDEIPIEHDILPWDEALSIDEAFRSDTSDEKSSSTSTSHALKNPGRLRKNYLPAGLFSDYFKVDHPPKSSKKSLEKQEANAAFEEWVPSKPLLPPPPYCEKYLRRTQKDFELPYDIWWAYTNSKLPGRNTVPSWNYKKIRTNIYAESVRPNTAGIDHPLCNCKLEVGCGDNCLNRMVYTECSPSNCPCRENCHNQKIQKHDVAPGVERFMTEDKGWGVRTKLSIQKGTYILEYVGEVVTEREFKDRMGSIYRNDTHHYCLHLDGGLVIDGHRMGSDGRFVNHSCDPNCEMQKWSVNGLSRMALFAKRNIEPGEELSYDYNFALFNPAEGQPCRCKAPQCRGVIGGKSQRVKPLPVEPKITDAPLKDGRSKRQRKRKASKNAQRLSTKEVALARVQQLSDREKKIVKQSRVFMLRTFEKIRRCKAKKMNNSNNKSKQITPTSPLPNGTFGAKISERRPSTPSSLAVQISALCSPRNIKTRGLSMAVQDPEVEKMAKMAVILRNICSNLETFKDPQDETKTMGEVILNSSSARKKKNAIKNCQKRNINDLKTLLIHIEQGFYKEPLQFDTDMKKLLAELRSLHTEEITKIKALDALEKEYEKQKAQHFVQLIELLPDEELLKGFCANPNITENLLNGDMENYTSQNTHSTLENNSSMEKTQLDEKTLNVNTTGTMHSVMDVLLPAATGPNEDIIRCICGLFRDEGLMIQCSKCTVWQHTECTKADVNADNYLCERCELREVDREIPLEDFTEDGHRYYLSLMRGDLQVRQGDAVYVLRDIPIKDAAGNEIKKHTYETIGNIDYNECDIFRVERLWKTESGKRLIFGHHFLRPHETFHEPSRRFYPNEVVRVPLYEVVPIELVIGRCWVLDRTTFCKGRPIECLSEDHCYICELRVDRSARFFAKAKTNYPSCTKSYAFRKFQEKLRISKSYAPHIVDPALLKNRKQRSGNENLPSTSSSPVPQGKQKQNKANNQIQQTNHKKKGLNNALSTTVQLNESKSISPSIIQITKDKRSNLESFIKTITIKNMEKNPKLSTEPPEDVTYLLSGRGARQRKSLHSSCAISNSSSIGSSSSNIYNVNAQSNV